jgi:universal stress protein A
MSLNYKRILLALDITEDMTPLMKKCQDIVTDWSDVYIAHVIEPIAMAYASDTPIGLAELEEHCAEEARHAVNRIGDTLGVKAENRLVLHGNPSVEIEAAARDKGIELLIIGTHDKHGLMSLFGSTTKHVIQHAPCDVLGVHLQD